MDFVHEQLARGRKIRALTVVGTFSRFSPVIDPRFIYRSENVVEVLGTGLAVAWAIRKPIRGDRGTEFVSRNLDLWAYAHGASLAFSRPRQADRPHLY
jgi:putative transposase